MMRFWRFETRQARIGAWALLFVLTGLRLGLAARVGVTPDEAYYRLWALHLQSGYLDHPPMIALWIRLGTTLFGDGGFGIRVLGPVSALAGSAFLIQAGRDLFGTREAGYRAALLLNATLMLGLGAATATPDTPLVFFLALVLAACGRLLATGNPAWWLGIGAGFALAFDSKYTAVLPAAGCGLWFLTSRVQRHSWPFVLSGAVLGAAMISPVLWWNATHHWASFLKQGGRAGDWNPLRALNFLLELVGGQIGLATPLIFALFCLGIVWCVRYRRSSQAASLLAWMSLVPALVFVQHALGARVQANWPVVIYPVMALGAAATGYRIGTACCLGLFMTSLVTLQGIFALLPLSAHFDVIARQSAGWDGLIGEIRQAAPDRPALVAGDYALASILRYHAKDQPVLSYDSRWRYLDSATGGLDGATGGKAPEDRSDLSVRPSRRAVSGRAPERMPDIPSGAGSGGRSMLLVLREGERADLPALWLKPALSGHVCRRLRGMPVVCYRLVPLAVMPLKPTHRLGLYRLP